MRVILLSALVATVVGASIFGFIWSAAAAGTRSALSDYSDAGAMYFGDDIYREDPFAPKNFVFFGRHPNPRDGGWHTISCRPGHIEVRHDGGRYVEVRCP